MRVKGKPVQPCAKVLMMLDHDSHEYLFRNMPRYCHGYPFDHDCQNPDDPNGHDLRINTLTQKVTCHICGKRMQNGV